MQDESIRCVCKVILKFKINIFILFFIFFNLNAQEKIIIEHLKHYRLDSASYVLQNNNIPNLKWQNDFLISFNSNDAKISIDTLNTYFKSSYFEDIYNHINKGDVYFYKYLDKNIEALKEYQIALELAEKTNDTLLINETLKKILTFHRIDLLYDNITYKPYLKKYKLTANDSLEKAYYHYFNLILNFKNYKVESWDSKSYRYLNHFFSNHQVPYLKGISYTVYASYFEEMQQKDSIWHYINKAEKNLLLVSEKYTRSRLNQLYSFTARIAAQEKNPKKASIALKKINKNHYNKIDYKIEALSTFYQAMVDTLNGDYKSAIRNINKSTLIQDSILMKEYNNLLNELETKYQTTKKEKQIILQQTQIKEEQRQQKNLWIGGFIILLFGSVLSFLIYKNVKRKQLIAEQEREIEIQKKEKILKDQELNTIDAMIEGQEKERQRLADDLHDSVGATLSAARLQFEYLCKHIGKGVLENEDELFSKTGKLLEEAYQEIRSMAHLKNSGVIATKGLLPAIQKLARNASTPRSLEIEVNDYGLSKKIDASLEISIFRVIQELVTNIIKHSKASEATISITQHEEILSIIIEDNGIGFDVRKKINNDGMGLNSIEKRIEHLEGSIDIDSTIGKGTNILIDIPI